MATVEPSPFDNALASFKASLGPSVSAQFAKTTLKDLKQEVSDMQNKQNSKRRLQNMHRLRGVIIAMEQYGKVIEVFLNANDILAFVWVVSSFSEAFNGLLDTYQLIGESLPLLDKCQGFLDKSPHVREALQFIYCDILKFHHEAIKYFRKSSLKQIFQATWPVYKTKFGPIIDNLKRHKQLIEGRITHAQLETAIANSNKLLVNSEEQQKNSEKKHYRAVKSWLNSADIHIDQESFSSVRATNTKAGKWLLQDNLFQAWQSGGYKNPLLWLCGIPGAGKTVLASLIIEECQQLAQKTIWFYCKHEDSQRNTFVALARSLISQLLDHDRDLLPYIHGTMCNRGEPILSSEILAKDLLGIFLKSFNGLYIIIDGLDECPPREEKEIIDYFYSMVKNSQRESQSPIQCLFVSQPDGVAVKSRLRGIPKIEINSNHNSDDISAFVRSQSMEIKSKFRLPDTIVQNLNNLVTERAGGMFLYAKLVMSSLLSQISQKGLLEEIYEKGIPDGLEEAYSRVLTVVLDQSSRAETLQLLGWLTCAKRQLKWREVQGAVSIDIQGLSVESESRQWVLDSKDLCGSLVNLRSDGSLELVHSTAKAYLTSSGTINLLHEEREMASLCLVYLSLPGFYVSLDDTSILEMLHDGYYAFLDYAVCYWVMHLKAGVQSDIDEQSVTFLANCAQRFLDIHHRGTETHIEVPEHTRQRLNSLSLREAWPNFERFLAAFCATESQTQAFGESAALNDVLDIPDVISRIRRLLEEANFDNDGYLTKGKIQTYYGNHLFKCSRMSCDFFHLGFLTAKQRNDHMMKHSRPFKCSVPGCPGSSLAFSSQKDLESHIFKIHRSTERKHSYPLKRKRYSLKCTTCKEIFLEPQGLRHHICRGHLKEPDRNSPLPSTLGTPMPTTAYHNFTDSSIPREPAKWPLPTQGPGFVGMNRWLASDDFNDTMDGSLPPSVPMEESVPSDIENGSARSRKSAPNHTRYGDSVLMNFLTPGRPDIEAFKKGNDSKFPAQSKFSIPNPLDRNVRISNSSPDENTLSRSQFEFFTSTFSGYDTPPRAGEPLPYKIPNNFSPNEINSIESRLRAQMGQNKRAFQDDETQFYNTQDNVPSFFKAAAIPPESTPYPGRELAPLPKGPGNLGLAAHHNGNLRLPGPSEISNPPPPLPPPSRIQGMEDSARLGGPNRDEPLHPPPPSSSFARRI